MSLDPFAVGTYCHQHEMPDGAWNELTIALGHHDDDDLGVYVRNDCIEIAYQTADPEFLTAIGVCKTNGYLVANSLLKIRAHIIQRDGLTADPDAALAVALLDQTDNTLASIKPCSSVITEPHGLLILVPGPNQIVFSAVDNKPAAAINIPVGSQRVEVLLGLTETLYVAQAVNSAAQRFVHAC